MLETMGLNSKDRRKYTETVVIVASNNTRRGRTTIIHDNLPKILRTTLIGFLLNMSTPIPNTALPTAPDRIMKGSNFGTNGNGYPEIIPLEIFMSYTADSVREGFRSSISQLPS